LTRVQIESAARIGFADRHVRTQCSSLWLDPARLRESKAPNCYRIKTAPNINRNFYVYSANQLRMAKIKTKAGTAEPAAEPVSSRVCPPDPIFWDDYRASWIAVFSGLSLLLIVLVWGPLSRIGVHYSIAYNEGNAAYFSRQAVTGPPLYAVPPKFVYVDYPPLSYHLVGLAGKLAGNYVAAGRWFPRLRISRSACWPDSSCGF
jgi:hypothetical protein